MFPVSNKRNGAAAAPVATAAQASRTVGVRLPDDLYRWLEERQAAFYVDSSVKLSLSALIKQILQTVKREATPSVRSRSLVDPALSSPSRKASR